MRMDFSFERSPSYVGGKFVGIAWVATDWKRQRNVFGIAKDHYAADVAIDAALAHLKQRALDNKVWWEPLSPATDRTGR